jgi:hypothetical protein
LAPRFLQIYKKLHPFIMTIIADPLSYSSFIFFADAFFNSGIALLLSLIWIKFDLNPQSLKMTGPAKSREKIFENPGQLA